MDTSTLLLFVPACFALNMAPGPNNLLSVSNAARYGFRHACAGAIGRLLAFVGMLALASAGLAVVLQASETVFALIKFAGAAYLLFLAVNLWRAPVAGAGDAPEAAPRKSRLELARQEFLVAAGNPKAILIFTAFLPQFVNAQLPAAGQFTLLGALFLLLECLAIALYAYMGVHMQALLGKPRARRMFNRGCAGLLAGAAAGLLLSRRA